MAMNVFLFPGQGAQEIGMAADLFKADAAFRGIVQRASERAGADLEKICLRGPERELTRTKHLQPLLVCVSLGYLRHLSEHGVQPDVVLGHSLGEITALAAAGVVTPHDAVDMAAKRGELVAKVREHVKTEGNIKRGSFGRFMADVQATEFRHETFGLCLREHYR